MENSFKKAAGGLSFGFLHVLMTFDAFDFFFWTYARFLSTSLLKASTVWRGKMGRTDVTYWYRGLGLCLLDFVVMAFWMDYLWSCLPTVGSVDAPNRASCICCRQVAVSPVLALKVGETLSPFSVRSRLVVCFCSACVDLYRSLSALFLVRWLLSLRMRWFVLF